MMVLISVVIAVLAVVLVGFIFMEPRIGEHGLEFRLFGLIPVWTVPYVSIVEIRRVSFARSFVDPDVSLAFRSRTRWRGRNLAVGEEVLIKRRSGIIRRLTVTPEDADEFISTVRERIDKLRV